MSSYFVASLAEGRIAVSEFEAESTENSKSRFEFWSQSKVGKAPDPAGLHSRQTHSEEQINLKERTFQERVVLVISFAPKEILWVNRESVPKFTMFPLIMSFLKKSAELLNIPSLRQAGRTSPPN